MDKTDPPEWADLNYQQKLFSQAAKIWRTVLTDEVKKQWKTAIVVASLKPVCLIVPVAMLATAFLNPAAGLIFTTQQLAVITGLLYAKNIYELKGYDLWISVYLTMKGEHWINYPAPPPETWNPF